MPSIAMRTYIDMQCLYLILTVTSVWAQYQQDLFKERKNKQLVLGRDARMDSPGHSAKYGSYSLMDLGTTKVIELQLVQVNYYIIYMHYCSTKFEDIPSSEDTYKKSFEFP